MIDVILAVVAVILARENRGLLVGEGVDSAMVKQLRSLVLADSSVSNVLRLLTLHFGPHDVLLNIEIQFHRHLSAEEITQAIDRLESTIRHHYPDIHNIFVEAKALTGRTEKRL